MKIALEHSENQRSISHYAPGRATVGNHTYRHSLLLLPGQAATRWTPQRVETLQAADFEPIAALPLDVVILGTGEVQTFPEPAVLVPLMDRGIGFEVMHNAAACRTFNILLGEHRQVALALLIDATEG